jgi:hypothetical protein
MANSNAFRILANMNIETGDLVFYVYEFMVICGLIFRVYLEFEGNPLPRPEVEILPPLRPPEPIVTVPEIVESVPVPKPPRKHPVTKKEYIDFFKEVLNWCEKNIKLGRDRKIRPRIDISFSQKGNVLGYYQYSIKRIMMYVLKNENLRDNVKTFIHEYVHHLQIRGKNDNIRYNNQTRRKGYYDNDYEREARDLSSFYLNDCCEYLNL